MQRTKCRTEVLRLPQDMKPQTQRDAATAYSVTNKFDDAKPDI